MGLNVDYVFGCFLDNILLKIAFVHAKTCKGVDSSVWDYSCSTYDSATVDLCLFSICLQLMVEDMFGLA
jgi:hypothetical protein